MTDTDTPAPEVEGHPCASKGCARSFSTARGAAHHYTVTHARKTSKRKTPAAPPSPLSLAVEELRAAASRLRDMAEEAETLAASVETFEGPRRLS